jgi:hypothetical protein
MRGSARSAAPLLSIVFLGTCWPADLPVPAEQLQPVWTHELTSIRAPAHIGVQGGCVVWVLGSQSNQLERWSCAGKRLAALSAAAAARPAPALLVQHNGTVSLWSGDLRRLLVVGDTSAGSALSGQRKLPLNALMRAFLDQSLSLYCGEHYAEGALEESRVRTIAWRNSVDDWLEITQLAPVASSALPRAGETISLTGLSGRSTRCLVNRQDDVVIAWSPQRQASAAPDSSAARLEEALERISAGAPAERIKFLDAAYDHNRDELWLRQHRIARPRAVQFLVLPLAQTGSRRRVGTREVKGSVEAFAAHEGDAYLLTRNEAGSYTLGRYAVRPARSND